jgi:hypothetical protein
MLPTKFWFIWPSSFRGEDFKKSANQKQELPVAAVESWKNKNIDGFYTKTTQKGGFSKLCVKNKKRQTYSIFQHVTII